MMAAAMFRRDRDDVDELLAETHETVGRMKALLEELSSHIGDLENKFHEPGEGEQ